MAKKTIQTLGIVLGSVIGAALLSYLIVSFRFADHFMPGTSINSENVSSLSPDQVNRKWVEKLPAYEMSLVFCDEETTQLSGASFDFEYSYMQDLKQILKSQNRLEWGWYYLNPTSYTAGRGIQYSEEKLRDILDALPSYHTAEENEAAVLSIENRSNRFYFNDERETVLDTKQATDAILAAAAQGESEVDLTGFFDAPQATEEQAEIIRQWDAIQAFQDACIHYRDGEISLDLNKYIFTAWIVKDGNGMPVFDSDGRVKLDEDKIRNFVPLISKAFNTDGLKRKWKKYQGGETEISCSWKGYIVDEEAEVKRIVRAISEGLQEERTPVYSQVGEGHGNDEVGDSYVEVDLGNQRAYFFREKQLKWQTDIVTGCMRYHYDTPSMITKIYFMQKGRTLRGETYEAYVNYWMAFYKNYGLHDATWRKEFGKDIYLTDGSHGCVNLPKDKAAELFEMVEVGTPVVLYYQ